MRTKIYFISLFMSVCLSSFAQENMMDFVGVGERIKHSMRESERQKDALSIQTQNTAIETQNKKELSKYKNTVKQVQERLDKVSIVLDILKVTSEGTTIIKQIKYQQEQIIGTVPSYPYLLVHILPTIVEMTSEIELIGRYLAGVVLTGSEIYAMDNADRKIITNFIISELRHILTTSTSMYMTMRNMKLSHTLRKNAFNQWVNKDKQIVKEIIENAKKI